MIHTYKIKMVPIGDKEAIDYAYTIIRRETKFYSEAMNMATAVCFVLEDDRFNDQMKNEFKNVIGREPNSKLPNMYSSNMEHLGKGLNLASCVSRTAQANINNDKKNNKYKPRYYKDNSPFPLRKRFVTPSTETAQGMYHKYESDDELFAKLSKSPDVEIFINLTYNTKFRLELGRNPYKSKYVRDAIKNIYLGIYEPCDSKIGLKDRDSGVGQDIYLYLTVDIPQDDSGDLHEDVVCGMDIGVAVPICCALNNDYYRRAYVGNGEMLINYTTKMKYEIQRRQKMAKYCKGGHGRKRKTRIAYNPRLKRENFKKEMCRKFAKEAVRFAYNNHAKYIHMENLTGISDKNKVLKKIEWPFYMLQEMIEYEAGKYGIIVKYVDPKNTSKTCSVCGSLVDGQRNGRSFMCANKGCKSHSLYTNKDGVEFFHADFNGARNIAMSTNFMEKGKKGKKKKANSELLNLEDVS